MRYRALSAGLAMMLAAAVAVTAACSSSTSKSSGNGASSATAYQDCMRKNGVDMQGFGGQGRNPSGGPVRNPSDRPRTRPSGSRPPGGPDGGMPDGALPPSGMPSGSGGPGGFGNRAAPSGVDASAWAKAQQVCASLRPSRGPGGGPDGGGGQNGGGANAAYLNCLSEHGVTPSGGIRSLDSTDPKTGAAMQACSVLRPTNGS